MKFFTSVCFVLLGLISCKPTVARKPITQKSATFFENSIERNIALKEKEEALIQTIIASDTANTYLESGNGFWYTYLKQDSIPGPKPKFGEIVNFDYNLKNLDGNTIYSKNELKNQTYAIDKEIYFYGLREGIKLLQAGESALFIFPSELAYGYYGDEKKISSNIPLIAEVTLNSISEK